MEIDYDYDQVMEIVESDDDSIHVSMEVSQANDSDESDTEFHDLENFDFSAEWRNIFTRCKVFIDDDDIENIPLSHISKHPMQKLSLPYADMLRVTRVISVCVDEMVKLEKRYRTGCKTSRIENAVKSLKFIDNVIWLVQGDKYPDPWKMVRDLRDEFIRLEDKLKFSLSKRVAIKKVKKISACASAVMDKVMKKNGYCCGKITDDRADPIECNGDPNCVIRKENALYFKHRELIFCEKCFAKTFKRRTATLNFDEVYNISQFTICRYTTENPQFFVKCKVCGRLNHRKCMLHVNDNVDFICAHCDDSRNAKSAFKASQLPLSKCDKVVTEFLEAHLPGISKLITVRVLSKVRLKKPVKASIRPFKTTDCVKFTSYALFAFYRDNDAMPDMAIFSILFNIYEPSSKRTRRQGQIAYVDSVNFLPKEIRTETYQLIILGVFEFMRTEEVLRVFLWSAPSGAEKTYIFPHKPREMKFPNHDQLNEWYRRMLRKGMNLKVVDMYDTNMSRICNRLNMISLDKLPYFYDDLWEYNMQVAIQEVKKMKTKEITAMTYGEFYDEVQDFINANIAKTDNYFVIRLQYPRRRRVGRMKKSIDWKRARKIYRNKYKQKINQKKLKKAPRHPWINERSSLMEFFHHYDCKFSDNLETAYTTQMLLTSLVKLMLRKSESRQFEISTICKNSTILKDSNNNAMSAKRATKNPKKNQLKRNV